MAENPINQIARQLWAMSTRKRESMVSHENMRNERYQRTFTDEFYPPRMKGGYRPVDPEQKAAWEMLAMKGE